MLRMESAFEKISEIPSLTRESLASSHFDLSSS